MIRSSSSSTVALLGSSSDLEIPSENDADRLAYDEWVLKIIKIKFGLTNFDLILMYWFFFLMSR